MEELNRLSLLRLLCHLTPQIEKGKCGYLLGERFIYYVTKIKISIMAHEKNISTQKTKKSFKNFFFGILAQIIILALGVIIPKLIIRTYGSETNGLINTLNQVFTYVALIEAGVGGATVNILYQYVVRNEKQTINNILSASRKYYRRAAIFYILAVVLVAVVYPFVAKTTVDYWTIFFLVLIQGATGVLSFITYAPLSMLLQAEGQNYIISNIDLAAHMLASAFKIILYLMGVNIILIQLVYFAIVVLKCFVFMIYQHFRYEWIVHSSEADMSLLKGKTAYVFSQIAETIFSSTDIILLSILTGMTAASVYSVYAMIFTSLQSILTILISSTGFSTGQAYYENRERYIKLHDSLEAMISNITFCVISAACILTIPFITIYTKNVTDADYIDSLLPYLFSLVVLLYIPRRVCQNLISTSGNVRRMAFESVIEMVLNISLSIPLVIFFGIRGTLIATIVSLLYRTNDIFVYANTKILGRKPTKVYLLMAVDFVVFASLQIAARFVNLIVGNYLAWLFEATIVFAICIICYGIVMATLNHNESIFLFNSFKTFLVSRKNITKQSETKREP